jgi:hypothetical protein
MENEQLVIIVLFILIFVTIIIIGTLIYYCTSGGDDINVNKECDNSDDEENHRKKGQKKAKTKCSNQNTDINNWLTSNVHNFIKNDPLRQRSHDPKTNYPGIIKLKKSTVLPNNIETGKVLVFTENISSTLTLPCNNMAGMKFYIWNNSNKIHMIKSNINIIDSKNSLKKKNINPGEFITIICFESVWLMSVKLLHKNINEVNPCKKVKYTCKEPIKESYHEDECECESGSDTNEEIRKLLEQDF